MSGTIALIGGWEIGRPWTNIETLTIDRYIKTLTNKHDSKFLFIPTASSDSTGYMQVVEEYFGKKVWYQNISHLTLHLVDYTKQEIQEIVNNADVIYVWGGNTKMMIEKRNETGLSDILKKSYHESHQTKVFCWLSAGSICRCRSGLSDSLSFADPNNTRMIKVDALDLVPVIHSPHQIRESHRLYELMKMVEWTDEIWISIDDSVCLVIANDQRSVLADATNPHAWAYKIRNHESTINIQRLHNWEYGTITDLYETLKT